jgi:hypothetical protein
MSSAPFSLVMPTATLERVLLLPSQSELGAGTDEPAFLASADGLASAAWVTNPPHISYRLQNAYAADGHEFWVVVWFSASKLVAVELALKTEDVAGGHNWDPASEQSANQIQIDLLARRYGSHPVSYSWGTIRSDYDPRGGGASITIRFAQSP